VYGLRGKLKKDEKIIDFSLAERIISQPLRAA
jgi:hypothetical protein